MVARRHVATSRASLAMVAALLLADRPVAATAQDAAAFLAGQTKTCVKCDLVGAALKQRDLSGDDLTDADLSRAVMHRAKQPVPTVMARLQPMRAAGGLALAGNMAGPAAQPIRKPGEKILEKVPAWSTTSGACVHRLGGGGWPKPSSR